MDQFNRTNYIKFPVSFIKISCHIGRCMHDTSPNAFSFAAEDLIMDFYYYYYYYYYYITENLAKTRLYFYLRFRRLEDQSHFSLLKLINNSLALYKGVTSIVTIQKSA